MKLPSHYKVTTLVLIHKGDEVLLGMKKRGFGEGRWNGFGGKVGEGETIEEAAHREMKEECSVEIPKLTKRALSVFHFPNGDGIVMHTFSGETCIGDPQESEEMRPQWFHVEKIPLTEMWPDDELWFPLFLKGDNFHGEFHFDENDGIIKHNITIVDTP